MAIYYAPLILTLAALTAQVSRSRQVDRGVLLASSFAVAMIAGLRWYADVDYAGYVEMFEDTPPLHRFSSESIAGLYGEPAYLLLNSIFKSLGWDFFLLAMVGALASMALKTFVAFRISRHASLAIALYLCVHFITIEFIQMRWAVATGFITLAYYALYRGKTAHAVLALAMAVCFHYFSLVFCVAAPLVRAEGYRRFQLMFVGSLLAAAFLSLETVAPLLVNESDAYLLSRITRYASDLLSTVGMLSYAKLLMYPTLYLLCVRQRPSFDWKGDPLNAFLYKASLVSISLTLALSFIPIMHHRATVVADFFSILWILNASHIALSAGVRAVAWAGLVVLFSTWHVLDVGNYLAAGRLYEYRAWLTTL